MELTAVLKLLESHPDRPLLIKTDTGLVVSWLQGQDLEVRAKAVCRSEPFGSLVNTPT